MTKAKLSKEYQDSLILTSRKEWRDWLESNHKLQSGIWVIIIKKNSAIDGLRYEEAVEEALCYGWIDSKMKSIDEDRFIQRFSPRKPKSFWSDSNKTRVKKLTAEGMMTEAGVKAVKVAKKNGMWDYSRNISGEVKIPVDLEKALFKNKKARKNFNDYPPSTQKIYIHYILEAKHPETRERRIASIIERAEKNKRPGETL
jgi:uncharacterized protein YdeI (YjbR/CyaY-like superfamily)